MPDHRRRFRGSEYSNVASAIDETAGHPVGTPSTMVPIPPTVRSVLGGAAFYLVDYLRWRCSAGPLLGDGPSLTEGLRAAHAELCATRRSGFESGALRGHKRAADCSNSNGGDIAGDAVHAHVARTILGPHRGSGAGASPPLMAASSVGRCTEPLEDIVDWAICTLVRRREQLCQRRKKDDWRGQATALPPPAQTSSSASTSYVANDRGVNLLAQGYAPAREGNNGACPDMARGVLCLHPNATASFARSSPIAKSIHAVVGDEIMREILTECIVLVPTGALDRGNYMQLCGPPLTFYRRTKDLGRGGGGVGDDPLQQRDDPNTATPSKQGKRPFELGNCSVGAPPGKVARVELRDMANANSSIQKNPYPSSSGILLSRDAAKVSVGVGGGRKGANHAQRNQWNPMAPLPRHRMFYSDMFVKKAGLPLCHLLNVEDDGKEYGGCVERLLDSMVHLRVRASSASTKGRSNKRRKRWKRVRGDGLALCRELRKRHRNCDYSRLLVRFCPLPQESGYKGDRTSLDKASLSDLSAAYTCGDQVANFVTACLSSAFPGSFWGSRHNFDVVRSTAQKFILLHRAEQLPEKAIMKGIRVTEMRWLFGTRRTGKEKGVAKSSLSNHEAVTGLVQNVMRWVYNQYIIPLIRTCFYATETQFTAGRVVFYRKPVWSKLRALAMEALTEKQYCSIDAPEAARRLALQSLGFARLRILPKATGVRPIVTMCKKQCIEFEEYSPDASPCRPRLVRPTLEARYNSTNNILSRSLDVFKHEYNRSPGAFGCGVGGFNEVYPLLCTFVKDLKESEVPFHDKDKTTPLYFASVDLHRCYDNIDQSYLFRLVQRLINDNEYLVQHSSVLHSFRSQNKVLRRRTTRVCRPEELGWFPDVARNDLAQLFSHSIFVDNVNTSLVKKDDLLELLKEHIFSNLVVANGDFGPRFLFQSSGIPQGSVLSTILCNYYYGDLEAKLLGDLFDSRHFVDSEARPLHLLVRNVDDFLLISTNRATSERFLERMEAGLPELGVQINREKTRVSYDRAHCEANISSITGKDVETGTDGEEFFSWCGVLLDTKTCATRVDYSRFAGSLAVDGLTVDRLGCEGSKLLIRMKNFIHPRCMPILFDLQLHSTETALLNFHQAMLLCAIKTAAYICQGLEGGVESNPIFILRAIEDTISYAHSLILNRLRASDRSDIDGCSSIEKALTKPIANWLGRDAFRVVLKASKNSGKFRLISKYLRENITTSEISGTTEINESILRQLAIRSLRGFRLERFELP